MNRRKRKAPLIVVDCDRVNALWSSYATAQEICAAIGVTKNRLETIRADLRLPKRPGWKPWLAPWRAKKRPKVPDPEVSPEEVQHRIAKVQARWTDEMFALRAAGRVRPVPYEFPTVRLD